MKRKYLFVALAALASLLLAPAAYAGSLAFLGSLTDTTDYSPAGANLGQEGYWFANWDQSSISSGEEDLNAVDALPSWLTLFNDQAVDDGYSWANAEGSEGPSSLGTAPYTSNVVGYGGDANFASLTLPDGTTGRSGQAVDTTEAGNDGQNSTTVHNMVVGPGAPSQFRIHVVVDNEDATFGTGVRRVKMRLWDPTENEADTSNSIDGTRNNVPDVHSFFFGGVNTGDVIQIALRTTNSPIGGDPANIAGAGFAGFMVDVPEPASVTLLTLGGIALVMRRRRRR